ncbi:MAG: HAMP domain-containing protein [Proteobacteria bacterium]|nr:HAMP domain-containing protein [Pseudomonadota bacterium]
MDNPPPRRTGRLSLVHKLALAFIGLVALVLLVDGAFDMWLTYHQATRSMVQVQHEKAQAAADRVDEYITDIERQIGWTTRADWARVSPEQRRYDFVRLMRQVPAITEIAYIDATGHEQLRLSRLAADSIGTGTDVSSEPRFREAVANGIWFSPVTFRHGSEPYMTIAVAHAGRSGVTVAEVNLKLIWDVLTGLKVGAGGYAFVTDAKGRLIAHPDMSMVLRDTNLSHLPQVGDVLAGKSGLIDTGTGMEGDMVLSAHAVVSRTGWNVFVERPVEEALAPVYASLVQSVLSLGGGLVLAAILGMFVARRMVRPIHALQAGADRLGEGNLAQRISVRTGDEIETLAERFNTMAGRIQESHETLEAKVEDRTRELVQSLADLRAAQDRLVQTEKLASLGQLTAGIAHEIKNPLNFVNNFSDLSTELLDELKEALERAHEVIPDDLRTEIEDVAALLQANLQKIAEHGRRADSIVRNMLQHSRSGADEVRVTDLNALVEEALNLAYHGARAERSDFQITLERALDPAAGAAEVYAQQLSRALLNIMSNGFYAARKRAEAAPGGPEPALRVSTRDLGERVEIRIRDNGTGIPASVREKIFDPFFTTKPAGEGTGLGLSLTHDIVVKQHGGTLQVDSEEQHFTEFALTLHRKLPVSAVAARQAA